MRKKILLTTISVISVMIVKAQFENGKVYVDLTIGKRITRFSTYSVTPSVFIALNKHHTLGIFYDYTHQQRYSYSDRYGFGNDNTIGVKHNYFSYFTKNSRLGWSINSTIGYSIFNLREFRATTGEMVTKSTSNSFVFTVKPGIFYKLSERLLIHANIGGASFRKSGKTLYRDINFASQINVGLTLKLGNRKNKK